MKVEGSWARLDGPRASIPLQDQASVSNRPDLVAARAPHRPELGGVRKRHRRWHIAPAVGAAAATAIAVVREPVGARTGLLANSTVVQKQTKPRRERRAFDGLLTAIINRQKT